MGGDRHRPGRPGSGHLPAQRGRIPGRDPTRSAGWRLEFLLQSTQDPSLLVPAAQAWSDDGSLRRWLDRPHELLLAELGRASRIYPELAAGLRQATPCALDLDADGAHRFLAVVAPALDEAGFGVLLPSWWDRRARLGLKASASTPTDGVVAGGHFGRESLMDFRWQLAVGDDTLTDDEIVALAETKAPLVRLRGQWVAVDPEQLRRGLEFLRRAPAEARTAAEVLALAASHPDDLDTPLPVTGVQADGWLGELLAGTAARSLTPVDPPAAFEATLRPYQERGLSWLAFLSSLGLGSCLADDMGLGKTVQLLALESAHRDANPDAGPTLLLCPMSLVGNWQREAARFAPQLRVYAHHGRERLRGDALRERLAVTDLVVTTYATGTRDIDELSGLRLAAGGARRGAGDQEQPVADGQGHAPATRGTPGRADRHPGGEPAGRTVVDHGLPQPRDARLVGAVPRPLRHPGGAARRHRACRAAAGDHPALHPAAAQDRSGDHRRSAGEDRDEGVLPADRGAGVALPVDRGRHDGEDRELRGHRAPRQRAGRDGQAQAGVQPPRPAAA